MIPSGDPRKDPPLLEATPSTLIALMVAAFVVLLILTAVMSRE